MSASLLAATFLLSLVGCGADTGTALEDHPALTSGDDPDGDADGLGLGGDPGGGGAGAGNGNGVCGLTEVTFEQVVPTVVLLIDQSGSMTESFGSGYTRWDAVKHALLDPNDGVVVKLNDEVRFGLTLYTSYGGNQGGVCPVLTEVAPAVSNHAGIQAVLDSSSPEQDTPTAESVTATAAALAQVQEPGPKVIVLATDGMPDTCADPHNYNTAASVASVAAAHTAGIDTYVISVGDGVSDSHLQDLANAGVGQNNASYHQALDPQSLIDDFNQIIQGVQDCVFSVNGVIDPNLACQGTVSLDGVELGCNQPDGWKLNGSSEIELVGAACDAIQDGNHTLEGVFPCDAFSPDPR